jgi:peptidoglycan hydrolase FlgJ
MTGNELQKASVYTDFSGLADIRRGAGKNSAEALKQAAQQFESMFMQMMLKSMREAGGSEDGLFDSDQTRLYQDMYDKQLSLSLSEGGNGIGLAKMLVQQLQSRVSPVDPESATHANAVPKRGDKAFEQLPSPTAAGNAASISHAAEPEHFDSPEQFVATLWPHAQRAGKQLGVDPRAILAQAALETGWGKSVIRDSKGHSSHNLFNIKADQRWEGERMVKRTLEYRNGVAVKEQAGFRAYDSWEESFNDYAAFLKGSGRYQEALRAGNNPGKFVQHLQDAGYATDPAYASKIKRILNNELVAKADTGLKLSSEQTLTSLG